MSKTPHEPTAARSEHGTTASYVVGFILSLVFTIIPYELVVKHVLHGNVLIATILGFGVLQMLIQIVFFLHLGRQKKPNWQLFFFASTVGIILVVVVASIWIMNHLHYNMTLVTPADASKKLIDDEAIPQIGGQKTGACEVIGKNHQIVIKDGQASPASTTAAKCDTLTFINQDSSAPDLAFNKVYAGLADLTVHKGHTETITLSQTGAYTFQAKSNTQTSGSFTISP